MAALFLPEAEHQVSLLDVGCGYGGLFLYLSELGRPVNYTGIDVCDNMIAYAREHFSDATFLCEDIFNLPDEPQYDYVVCNGILTQKLALGIQEMDAFTHRLIKKMFTLCRKGVAFNVMTTKVNFMVDNLYYRNPVELLAYCMTELTGKVRLDHAYRLYEYTMYLYKEVPPEA
jgi:SAM-dependent methyltransferase